VFYTFITALLNCIPNFFRMLSLIWSHMLCPTFPMLFSRLSCVSMLLPIAALFLSARSHKIPLFLPYIGGANGQSYANSKHLRKCPKFPNFSCWGYEIWPINETHLPEKKNQSFEVWMQSQVIHRIHIILSRYDLFLTYPNHGESIKTSNWFP
jgi:hypothetical protein